MKYLVYLLLCASIMHAAQQGIENAHWAADMLSSIAVRARVTQGYVMEGVNEPLEQAILTGSLRDIFAPLGQVLQGIYHVATAYGYNPEALPGDNGPLTISPKYPLCSGLLNNLVIIENRSSGLGELMSNRWVSQVTLNNLENLDTDMADLLTRIKRVVQEEGSGAQYVGGGSFGPGSLI